MKPKLLNMHTVLVGLFCVSLMNVHGLHVLKRTMVQSQLNHGINEAQMEQDHVDMNLDGNLQVTKQRACLLQFLGNDRNGDMTAEDQAGVKVVEDLFNLDGKLIVGKSTISLDHVDKNGGEPQDSQFKAKVTKYLKDNLKGCQSMVVLGPGTKDGIGVWVDYAVRKRNKNAPVKKASKRIRVPFSDFRTIFGYSTPLYIASCMCNNVEVKFCENGVINPVQFSKGRNWLYGWTSIASSSRQREIQNIFTFESGAPPKIDQDKGKKIYEADNRNKIITFDDNGNKQSFTFNDQGKAVDVLE